MPTISNCSKVLDLLAKRTYCGLAFDKLGTRHRSCSYAIAGESIKLRWQGHHQSPEIAPWSVGWSNGAHHIVLWLKPSPGAWIFAQCYFDRLAPSLARTFIHEAFQPIFATLNDGPWVIDNLVPTNLLKGGARVVAANSTKNLTFEFELAFSSVSAAQDLGQSLDIYADSNACADVALECELHLATLELDLDQVRGLRVGDLLLGGVCTGRSAAKSTAFATLTAKLLIERSMRALALLQLNRGCWRVVKVHPVYILEPTMKDDAFFPEHDTQTGGTEAAESVVSENQLDISNLLLKVDIVASKLSLTVAAIQALRPGDVLELAQALDDSHIEIRIGGRHFALGTLIALEGRLAVQINKLNGPSIPFRQ